MDKPITRLTYSEYESMLKQLQGAPVDSEGVITYVEKNAQWELIPPVFQFKSEQLKQKLSERDSLLSKLQDMKLRNFIGGIIDSSKIGEIVEQYNLMIAKINQLDKTIKELKEGNHQLIENLEKNYLADIVPSMMEINELTQQKEKLYQLKIVLRQHWKTLGKSQWHNSPQHEEWINSPNYQQWHQLNEKYLQLVQAVEKRRKLFFESVEKESDGQLQYVIAQDAFIKLKPKLVVRKEVKLPEDFPYRASYMPPFNEMFTTLQQTTIDPIAQEGLQYGLIERQYPDQIESMDSMVDWFIEKERAVCQINADVDTKTPVEQWIKIRKPAEPLLDKEDRKKELINQHTLVYKGFESCHLFNISLAVHMMNLVRQGLPNPNELAVLDVSAGWGERLVSAFAVGAKIYRSWSPNEKFAPIYLRIAQACAAASKLQQTKWTIDSTPIEQTFEQRFYGLYADLKNRFDVAFMIYPWYDKDLYHHDKTPIDWYEQYYVRMLLAVVLSLKRGGVLFAFLPVGKLSNVAMNIYDKLLGYAGKLGYRQKTETLDPIQPIFIWVKSRDIYIEEIETLLIPVTQYETRPTGEPEVKAKLLPNKFSIAPKTMPTHIQISKPGIKPPELQEDASKRYLKRIEYIYNILNTIGPNPPDIMTYDDIPMALEYQRSRVKRYSYHVGQFKLFISELRFLNAFARGRDNKFVVIYAGSAPGHHDAFLCDLFPNMRMILIDPEPHEIKNVRAESKINVKEDSLYYKFSEDRGIDTRKGEMRYATMELGARYINREGVMTTVANKTKAKDDTYLPKDPTDEQRQQCAKLLIQQLQEDMAEDHHRRFYIVEDYFGMAYADVFSQIPDVLYISDIRTNLSMFLSSAENDIRNKRMVKQESEEGELVSPSDLDIIANNAQQHLWIKHIKPRASMLKFRAPFHNENDRIDIENYAIETPSKKRVKFYADIIDAYKNEEGIKRDIIADYLADVPPELGQHYYWVETTRFDLQAFQGSSSTESRAIVLSSDLDKPLRNYNFREHEQKFFAYNIMREFLFYEKNRPYFNASIGIDGCPDCNILISTFVDYVQISDESQRVKQITELIRDCLVSFDRSIKITFKDYRHFNEHGTNLKYLSPAAAVRREAISLGVPIKYIPPYMLIDEKKSAPITITKRTELVPEPKKEPPKVVIFKKPPVIKPQVIPPPVIKPQVIPPPVIKPQVIPPPVAKPQVIPSPVAKPQVIPPPVIKPVVTEPARLKIVPKEPIKLAFKAPKKPINQVAQIHGQLVSTNKDFIPFGNILDAVEAFIQLIDQEKVRAVDYRFIQTFLSNKKKSNDKNAIKLASVGVPFSVVASYIWKVYQQLNKSKS